MTDVFKKNDQTHFFRYFDAAGTIATLQTQSLRLTSPGNLNDPDDLYFRKVVPFTADELRIASAHSFANALCNGQIPPLLKKRGLLPHGLYFKKRTTLSYDALVKLYLGDPVLASEYRKHFESQTERMNQELHAALSDHFLLCLTTEYTNPRMWEIYADRRRGAVLRFECIPALDNVFRAALPVVYSDHAPTYGSKEEWLDTLEGGDGMDIPALYKRIITWKSLNWEYENEWRVVLVDKDRAGQKHTHIGIQPAELSEIYLGSKISDRDREAIVNMVHKKYTHVKVLGGM